MSVFKVIEIELTYKYHTRPSILPEVTTAEAAYDILHNQWDQTRIEFVEDFKILLLNRQNRVLGLCHLCNGGTATVNAEPKLIFAAAIKANASSIILAHNHPSGKLQPSASDVSATNQIVQAGTFLGIPVIDHLIVSNDGYYSIISNDVGGRNYISKKTYSEIAELNI